MKKLMVALFLSSVALNGGANAQGNSVNETKLTESSVLLSNGIHLKYSEQGDPKGVPVILLHGLSDSWHSFAMTMPYFPSSIHAYAISQRGHGNSSKPRVGYDPTDFADDIADF